MHKARVVFSLAMVLVILGLLPAACSGRDGGTSANVDPSLPVVTVYKAPT
jgi:hypothetical protein